MAELDFASPEVETDQPPVKEEGLKKDWKDEIGQVCAFDWSPEPMYIDGDVIIPDEFEDDDRDVSPLSEDAKTALMELDMIGEKADIAPRRVEVEQAWRANHYDRGYQFLLHNRKGGWTFPTTGQYSAGAQWHLQNVYQTNVYGEKGEIITAALAREVPKVEFFPANPEHAPDQSMADVSDDLKDIWAKNNNLHALLQDAAKKFWTDDRCLFWTFYEINGEEYGYEDPEQPVVPEDEQKPPTEPTGDEGSTEYEEENKSVVSETASRRPRGRVRTRAFGKLDHRTPINVDCLAQMGIVPIYEDKDEAIVKAQLPWMSDKVTGGGDGTGETDLSRIARENVRQAVPGSYITGDSINRHCVVKHTYIRRSMFYDSSVKEEVREELLDKFPSGALLVKAATEFAFARNECMDDHLTVGHPFPGQGQNRRALGESLLPIQDYINDLVSLSLDYAKSTVPKKWMDNMAFNVDALRKEKNSPGAIGPFESQPGKTVDQLIFVEPTPQPQPWLISYIQWIITSLSEQISGALPSLFGASITGQVGSEGVAIQRDQALQRVGCPWNSLQAMFASAARQAVMLTAKCANKDINDVVPGRGSISIRLNNLKGNVLCYPEANPEFPESWAQREQRWKELLDVAIKSPDMALSQTILDPRNIREFQSVLRLKGLVVKGADSVEKQEAELEILLRSGPQPNPKKLLMQQALQKAQDGMAQQVQGHLATGQAPNPEEQQQLQAAPQMMQQMQQQITQLPDQVSTVIVRGDESEDDAVEASVLFDWMNSPDGRKFCYGTPQQQQAFANVHLHWTEHKASAKKIAQQNAPPPQPPKVSFSVPADKMPPPEQAAIVTAGGIPANPQDFAVQDKQELNAKVAAKVIPDTAYAQAIRKNPDGVGNS
jgi:hypothetical protein